MHFSFIAFPVLTFTKLECPSISHGGNCLIETEYQLLSLFYSREKREMNFWSSIYCLPGEKQKGRKDKNSRKHPQKIIRHVMIFSLFSLYKCEDEALNMRSQCFDPIPFICMSGNAMCHCPLNNLSLTTAPQAACILSRTQKLSNGSCCRDWQHM